MAGMGAEGNGMAVGKGDGWRRKGMRRVRGEGHRRAAGPPPKSSRGAPRGARRAAPGWG
jgi:hypothetical protein